jgi:aminoglycoside phosphotransferase
MKDIPRWLAERLSKLRKPVEDDQQNDAESVNPDELELPRELQDLVNDTPPSDNGEYEIEATMGDITAPNLILDDPSSSHGDEPTGIDPYDTAKLHKK